MWPRRLSIFPHVPERSADLATDVDVQALAGGTESVCVEEVFDLTSEDVEVIDCGDDMADDVPGGAAPSTAAEPEAHSQAKRKAPPRRTGVTRPGSEDLRDGEKGGWLRRGRPSSQTFAVSVGRCVRGG